jgi:hypothetical protein
LANFVPNFLPFLAMESTLIYKGWKMDILYLIVPNRGLWFGWNGSQPLVQSVHCELSYLQENDWLGWIF